MHLESRHFSWMSFLIFFLVLLGIISTLDYANNLFTWSYWLTQLGLVLIGVVLLALFGYFMPNSTPTQSVLVAFTVGILTIIPAVLLGIGNISEFWGQYFSIAGGIAAGSFLTFLFLMFTKRRGMGESISAKQRRLQILKQRHTIEGFDTPPDVLMEIEGLEAEIVAFSQGK